jgi:hypothetical protein
MYWSIYEAVNWISDGKDRASKLFHCLRLKHWALSSPEQNENPLLLLAIGLLVFAGWSCKLGCFPTDPQIWLYENHEKHRTMLE